jgi:hypothetical protein
MSQRIPLGFRGRVRHLAAYVPFELALPWSGHWDDLPSAHAATNFFDLAAIVGLFFLGKQLLPGRHGRDLGVVLAFAWTAFPYTDYVMQSNSNDGLVAALLIWGLVAFSSLGWRAVLLALAAGAKFTPLFLVPLYATGYRGLAGRFTRSPKAVPNGRLGRLLSLRLPGPVATRLLYFGTVLAAVCALLLVYPAVKPGIAETWDRTIKSQLDRTSPFSIWDRSGGSSRSRPCCSSAWSPVRPHSRWCRASATSPRSAPSPPR